MDGFLLSDAKMKSLVKVRASRKLQAEVYETDQTYELFLQMLHDP